MNIFSAQKITIVDNDEKKDTFMSRNETSSSKRDNFRKEIRRKSLDTIFSEIRKSLVKELQSQTLRQIIVKLKIDFKYQEMAEMISIITQNKEDVDFNLKIASYKMEQQLVRILVENSQAITIIQKAKIIRILNYLTYYARESTQRLSEKDDFLDYLRVQIDKSNIQLEEHAFYLYQIICFLMNISSLLKRQINLYLAESDICHLISNKITSTINFIKHAEQSYKEIIYHSRESLLRLYKNLVIQLKKAAQISANLIGEIITDQTYFINHREKTFLMLAEGMNSSDVFWQKLMKHKNVQYFEGYIHYSIDEIQSRCMDKQFLQNKDNVLTEQQVSQFYSLIKYFNALQTQSENYVIDFVETVQQFLNGYMLAEFLMQVATTSDKQFVIQALRLYRNISRIYDVTAQQLLITKPIHNKDDLLMIFTDVKMIKGYQTSRYCLEILTNLLKKDHRYVTTLMQFRIHQTIALVAENKQSTADMLMWVIRLAGALLSSEIEIENRAEQRRIFRIFENKGITNTIQSLVNHDSRQVYTAAELFTELIIKERQKQRE